MPELLLAPWLPALVRETNVRVCSLAVLALWYSQHGSTMWPEGASSNWKTSVPVGTARSMSYSPGPQK
eukprot:6901951-Lingulodinium_polyedra.AAC.1